MFEKTRSLLGGGLTNYHLEAEAELDEAEKREAALRHWAQRLLYDIDYRSAKKWARELDNLDRALSEQSESDLARPPLEYTKAVQELERLRAVLEYCRDVEPMVVKDGETWISEQSESGSA